MFELLRLTWRWPDLQEVLLRNQQSFASMGLHHSYKRAVELIYGFPSQDARVVEHILSGLCVGFTSRRAHQTQCRGPLSPEPAQTAGVGLLVKKA